MIIKNKEDDLDNSLNLNEIQNNRDIKKNQERLNKIVESELKRLEIEKLTHEVSELKDANKLRKQFARWSKYYVTIFTICVLITMWLSATKARKFFGCP